MREFVFPNSKLSVLKKAVSSATNDIPTRVEVLTSLLYKTAVAAATPTSGCFKPSC
ncbi:putative chloramphenicol acetyltransferase-like domain superfamily [Helianthus anomalus]